MTSATTKSLEARQLVEDNRKRASANRPSSHRQGRIWAPVVWASSNRIGGKVVTFIDIKRILDKLVNGEDIRMHGPFWRGKTRDEFVDLKVFGLPLLVVGDAANSHLVKALRGQAPFGRDVQPRPDGARFNRMPSRRGPATEADIARVEEWINARCPDAPLERPMVAAGAGAAPSAADDMIHVRFWREFDDFFLFKSSAETGKHVFGFIGNSVPVWLRYAFDQATLSDWSSHIS